jgi:hypothetical protein
MNNEFESVRLEDVESMYCMTPTTMTQGVFPIMMTLMTTNFSLPLGTVIGGS